MDRALIFHLDRCTSCGLCESICSLTHTQTCDPERSRIRIARIEPQGIYLQMFCQQCEDAACIAACPVSAIGRSQATGALEIDHELCTLCEACMAACSFSGIGHDAVDQTIIACDLCGGEPNCVRFCETKAIEFLEQDSIVVQDKNESLQEFRELIKLLVPGESKLKELDPL